MQESREPNSGQNHAIILENRKTLTISGVREILMFDENLVVMHTAMGELEVRGGNLHVSELSVDSGDLFMEGKIMAMEYREKVEKPGIWERLFG